MNEDLPWSADTVALDQARREPSSHKPASYQLPRPRLSTIALRPVALVTLAIVAVVSLIVVAERGSPLKMAPIRKVANPAPSIAVKHARRVPTLPLEEPLDVVKTQIRRPKRPHEGRHGPKVRTATDALDESEPIVEPAPEPEPIPEAAPTPESTPPGVEFGL
jgi:hypothetical protein